MIKASEFIFPVDFVVLETESVGNLDSQIPVILSQPFLTTFNALINCRNSMMKLSFENTTVDLNIFSLQRQPAIFDGIDNVNWLEAYACEDSCANRFLENDLCNDIIHSSLILLNPLLLLHILLIPY